ncbi:hypothetical protein GCM10007962_15460 [Yeosuana aromativorans]|uniref:Uncharacterized protein n=1 Tax=Yeosuana aromativorans TaxID=288019 RepID=A0A8J3FJ52_9FLAO|nr:hypothetical protein [Yeosuana aromativorans]GGK22221.1 hypothetical protein GCM10007962_15460 [Yeosuana aromativorans]
MISKTNRKPRITILFIPICLLTAISVNAQTEFTTWGNLTGIRQNGQLININSSLVIVNSNEEIRETVKEGQEVNFYRENDSKIFEYTMGHIRWVQTITDSKNEDIKVSIKFSTDTDTLLKGAYFRVKLPAIFNQNTQIKISSPPSSTLQQLIGRYPNAAIQNRITSMSVSVKDQELKISQEKPAIMAAEYATTENSEFLLNFQIAPDSIAANHVYENTFTISGHKEINNAPITIKLFPDQQENEFSGLGGNFRLQNPGADPQVIDYLLNNLNVKWARVELPWRSWQPNMETNPLEMARKGNIPPKVKAAMEMAKRLHEKGVKIVLAAWFAPEWAIIGERSKGVNIDGSRGNPLDQSKKEKIYQSIANYLLFLKENYNVPIAMFSFNESDLGIDIRQTPEEHNQMISELGQYFKEKGLSTELLLGDTADANGWDFTTIASLNPEAVPYIGAVSFHSWRACNDENLVKWRDIANRINVPLLVGEGSIDAGAWRYPEIFEESTYAMEEIATYIKIMRQARPLSILQWQLTSDYSVLSGGGVFGNYEKELYPTQRFFNLKQLSTTPVGLNYIPVITNNDDVIVTALTNKRESKLAIHMVNNDAIKKLIILNLPKRVKKIQVYVTNSKISFSELKTIVVKNREAELEIPSGSFISLITN